MTDDSVVILGGARTPIGSFGGAFRSTPAHVLGSIAIREALRRATVPPGEIDEVVMGQVGQVGPDAFNARRCALGAEIPSRSTAMNVNRLCGSGLQAIWTAAQSLQLGSAKVVVAGGDENMSMQPFLVYGARDGYRLGDRSLMDGALSLLTDPFGNYPMGMTAERVAERFVVSRTEQDAFALESQRRAAEAIAHGRLRGQIVPVTVSKGKEDHFVETDEHPRPDVSAEKLAALRPVFKPDGTVTPGNSSGINDGAAAVVMMLEGDARSEGLEPLLWFRAAAVAGLDTEIMGYAPTLAVSRLLDLTGLAITDIAVVELNEAFAAQAVAVIRDLKLDPQLVNPNGGAIAFGHPIGATGAILTVKLLYELKRRDAQFGIVTMCIGGGQGIAALFENVR